MRCVLTVAGLGTRLLPVTKETPKEMLPIYSKSKKGNLILKPVLQVIYESLYDYKIKEFCFVTGRTKRAVRDHFQLDYELMNLLKKQNKNELADTLNDFFSKVKKSHISFIYQPKPIGFGDAISRSKKFASKDKYFLLHAGDDIVISKNNDHLRRLEKNLQKYDADIAILLEKVRDPSKYGVVDGPYLEKGVLQIKSMVEKPKNPPSKNAIIAIYIFKPVIFKYLT
ncbi:MAG: sugar phosphate nucleotidyltransferase, partial [Nitrosotalea sp.]